jgi:glycosyltransferase involved in cell wall biosynthesis
VPRPIRALVVLTAPPLPEGNAQGRCAVALIRGLRCHGVDVQAIAARRSHSIPGDVPEDLDVEIVPVTPPPRSFRTQLDRVRRPRGELRGEFATRVRELARSADVVHLDETEAAWCDEGVDAPSVVHVHHLVRREQDLGAPWTKGFRHVAEYALAERAAARRHRHLIASSPVVAAGLHELAPSAEITLAPLSVDPRYYEPAPLDGPPVAGLVGAGFWPPTQTAIRRLVTDIWPRVLERVPEARLRVAGRSTSTIPDLRPGSGVELVGEVPSAAEFLRGLSLLLYPVPRGSGMKVKVLEALAAGVPVVTTGFGAEGIEPGAGVIVADDDDALVAAAAALLADPDRRRAAGDAALQLFLRRYAPEPATEPLVRLYERMSRA